jgi:SSS family solute:Na+ symporter
MFVPLACLFAFPFLYYFAPKLRQYAEEFDLLSPIGILRHSYGSVFLGVLVTFIFIGFLSPYLSLQLVGLGKLLEVISDGAISYTMGVGGVLCVVLIYVLFGGMRAVAYTDAVQAVLIFVGMAVACFLLLHSYWDGFGHFVSELQAKNLEHLTLPGPQHFYTDITFANYVIFTMGIFFLPHLITRFMMAKNDEQVRRTIASTALVTCFAYIPGLLFGLMAVLLHPGLEQSNVVGGLIFNDLAALGVLGSLAAMMLLIGVLGASMSTADSILLSIAQMVTRDVVRPIWGIGKKAQVYLARGVMFLLLILAFWMGMEPPRLMIDLALYSAKGAGILIPLYLAIRWKKRSAIAAILAVMVATPTLLYLGLNKIAPLGIDGSIWAWFVSYAIFYGGSCIHFSLKKNKKAMA